MLHEQKTTVLLGYYYCCIQLFSTGSNSSRISVSVIFGNFANSTYTWLVELNTTTLQLDDMGPNPGTTRHLHYQMSDPQG